MNEEQKDSMTCDEVLSMYLREVSKRVNEQYYKTCLRFVLLYRECLNEYGWLKRRDHYQKAGILHQDEVINRLKAEEEREEALTQKVEAKKSKKASAKKEEEPTKPTDADAKGTEDSKKEDEAMKDESEKKEGEENEL